ncbi:MAG: PD-(D/E)XK nuclease family protein, partial [Clostridium sp.]|nr:PD-(D/E)XK nuclease family protein [Clostridium sp.]
MLHRLMELLVRSKNQMSVADMTTQILEECLPAEYELQREIFAHAVTATAERIRQGGFAQENGVPQDILQTLLTAEEVCTEVPFCYSEKQGDKTVLYNGIMDVVYCEHGNWHIIDYKTNQDGEHLDQKYHAQLDTYIKALKQTTGHEADAKIYHIEV